MNERPVLSKALVSTSLASNSCGLKAAVQLPAVYKRVINNTVFINCGKLLFLAGWGLALGACMNDANAQELVVLLAAL